MFKILSKELLAPNIYRMDIEAPRVAQSAKQYGRTFGSCLKQAWGSAKNMVRLAEQRAAFQKQMEERKHNVVLSHVGMSSLYANRAYSGD